MPQSIHTPMRKIHVNDGQVLCPLRGLIDVELCFYCTDLVTVNLDSKAPSITCKATDDISEEQRKAYKWMSLLQLAERYGNVSKVCRDHSISRSMFYRYKRRYEQYGFQGLMTPTRL
ncbi:helix-turn-helix domain-containing protein [Alicyclobacillus sp. SO9]|uniref:helix-turn-helix domain-containing protein n=1 Tax=Alicyclobacillus sp. SO9 TaxID=2665646 RepID=UPI0018E7ABC8|nr:helix-turn-helix domain-containing protein [Alicyclobacillus sp. SO9]QQE81040.1 helix-turn-helix domain-containing protein [Alicyclobacillus sp. SO9]